MEVLVGAPLMSATAGASVQGLFGVAGTFAPLAGTAAGAISSIGAGSLLSGLMTGAGAFGQIQAGNMQANILNLQAQQSELNARMETVKGRQQALQIRNQLDRDLASQNATFTARGVLQGEGSAAAASDASKENAEEDINVAQFGAQMGSESDKLQAASDRINAKAAKQSGINKAVNAVASYKPLQSLLDGI